MNNIPPPINGRSIRQLYAKVRHKSPQELDLTEADLGLLEDFLEHVLQGKKLKWSASDLDVGEQFTREGVPHVVLDHQGESNTLVAEIGSRRGSYDLADCHPIAPLNPFPA